MSEIKELSLFRFLLLFLLPSKAAMAAGEKINTTEQRAVMHMALRAPADAVR